MTGSKSFLHSIPGAISPGYGSLVLAILLWSAFASLLMPLTRVPPLMLTGSALLLGSLSNIRHWRQWQAPLRVWCWAVAGLLFYHLLLIVAFRWAAPVKANLVNYLWPLLIVLLAPLFAPTAPLRLRHIIAALLGFCGAALALSSRTTSAVQEDSLWGYGAAFMAALTWSSYTLYMRRWSHIPDSMISGFCALAGAIALLLHFVFETTPQLTLRESGWLLLLGLGPMGLAFPAWNRAAKLIAPRRLGVYAFAIPLLSTAGLLLVLAQPLTLMLAVATVLIVLAGILASVRDEVN